MFSFFSTLHYADVTFRKGVERDRVVKEAHAPDHRKKKAQMIFFPKMESHKDVGILIARLGTSERSRNSGFGET
jgi:hypothetical protein